MNTTRASIALATLAAVGLGFFTYGLALADSAYLLGTRPHHLESAANGTFGVPLLSAADDGSISQALPFDFSFYGASHKSVLVDPNGLLILDGGGFCDFCSGADVLQQHVAIAPLWADWRGGTVSYLELPDHVVFTWAGVQHYYDDAGAATFQASLYPGGQIEFNYGPDAATLAAVTVGISGGPAGSVLVNPDSQRATIFNAAPSYSFLAAGAVLPSTGGLVLDPGATPELDSSLLFGTGLAGLCGYARLRLAGRRREPS